MCVPSVWKYLECRNRGDGQKDDSLAQSANVVQDVIQQFRFYVFKHVNAAHHLRWDRRLTEPRHSWVVSLILKLMISLQRLGEIRFGAAAVVKEMRDSHSIYYARHYRRVKQGGFPVVFALMHLLLHRAVAFRNKRRVLQLRVQSLYSMNLSWPA